MDLAPLVPAACHDVTVVHRNVTAVHRGVTVVHRDVTAVHRGTSSYTTSGAPMNIRQLEYFIAIAEEHQITAAARRLNISQPPLSYELAQLERELDVQLVVREPRGVSLTDAGRVLYDRARRIVALTNTTEDEVRHVGKGLAGTLSIGVISSCGGLIPSASMLSLCDLYPQISFKVREGNTYEVLDMLGAGLVELGLVRTPFDDTGLCCRYQNEEPLACIIPARLGLKTGKACAIEDLAGQPLIIYRRFEKLIRTAFLTKGLEPQVACVNDDARTTAIWACAGMGIGLVPQTITARLNTEGALVRPLDCPDLVTRQAIVWKADRLLSPLGKRFIDLVCPEGEG